MKILITGIAGFLGFELANYLSDYEIIGIDIKDKPLNLSENVYYIKKSILDDDLNQVFIEQKPHAVIHLAWTVQPVHSKKLRQAYELDYNGTKKVLESCNSSKVKQLVFMSSTLAYGALQDNPKFLIEKNLLRAKKSFHYAYHKRLVENEVIQPFIKEHPEINVVILRPSGFLGPMAKNYVANILRSKILPVMIGGRNTRIQFLHIRDLLDAIVLIIQKNTAGIFNVSPDDVVEMKDIPKLLPGHKLFIPELLARLGISFAWVLHLYKAPSSYLDFVRFEFIASNEKIKKELQWNPKYSTTDAIKSLIIDYK